MVEVIRPLAFAVLVFLPGAWVTFGLTRAQLQFSIKLCAAAALSPVVVSLQFYVMRLMGLTFESTAVLLPLINLPVLYLVFRQRRALSLPDGRTVMGWLLIVLVPLAFYLPTLLDPQTRALGGHHWLYSAPVYRIANGELLLTDPDLAGLRLSYPWVGLIYQSVLSYLLDSPPAASFIWTNLVWLLIIFGFLVAIVRKLGGNHFSQVTSVIWLCFGVNVVGFFVSWAFTGEYGESLVLGELRFTPWLVKFLGFAQDPMGLALFITIAYLLLTRHKAQQHVELAILLNLVTVGLVLVYPPLFPAAVGLFFAAIITTCLSAYRARQPFPRRQVLELVSCLVVSGVVAVAYLNFLGVDRMSRPVFLSFGFTWLWKAIGSIVVTLPLLLGLSFVVRRSWPSVSNGTIFLALGGLASLALYAIFFLPGFYNEYKYVFTAAVCLAPFPALALEPLFQRARWRAYPAFALLTLILAFPLGYRLHEGWRRAPTEQDRPRLDLSGFALRLDDDERLAQVTDAIRERTPVDSLLVMRDEGVYFTALTGRQFYVAPQERVPLAGVNVPVGDILVYSRGLDQVVLADRRRYLDALFESADPKRMADSLKRILQFNRPVAIVAETAHNKTLLDWLSETGSGRAVYSANDYVVWLIDNSEGLQGFPLLSGDNYDSALLADLFDS